MKIPNPELHNNFLHLFASLTLYSTSFSHRYDTFSYSTHHSRFSISGSSKVSLIYSSERCSTQLEVNPGNQEHIEYFTDVMEWSEWFDSDTFSAILEGEFFPQWLDILYDWSHQSGVVLKEVCGWIEGWRSLFPNSVLENRYIILQFNRAWDIINEVLEGGNQIDPSVYRQPITYRHVLQNRLIQEKTDRMRDVSIGSRCDI